jgi:hypothetical protein
MNEHLGRLMYKWIYVDVYTYLLKDAKYTSID